MAKLIAARPDWLKPKQLLDEGKFNNSESGPFRIFAVYSVQWL
jgi:hypothetical protein